jgi:hypothetical protein
MSELSEASLETMLMKIREHMDETSERITMIPTHFICRPSDLEELGFSADEIAKMIKEKSE